jgi:hypothetical protein
MSFEVKKSFPVDETVEVEMNNFRKTLHEEVFSKKIGDNPPLMLKPEEVPIFSEVLDDSNKTEKKFDTKASNFHAKKETIKDVKKDSDDEIKPVNYLFSDEA